MAFKNWALPCLLALSALACNPLKTYTQSPSSLNYLMERAEPKEKVAGNLYVQVGECPSLQGRVDKLDTEMVLLVLYNSVKVDVNYYLDQAGIKEKPEEWIKTTLQKELDRNTAFNIVNHPDSAQFHLYVEVNSLYARTRIITQANNVNVPLGMGGVASLSRSNASLPEGFGRARLRVHLQNRQGDTLWQKDYDHKVEYTDQHTFELPIRAEWVGKCGNTNAVEQLSNSFKKNFSLIVYDLNNKVFSEH